MPRMRTRSRVLAAVAIVAGGVTLPALPTLERPLPGPVCYVAAWTADCTCLTGPGGVPVARVPQPNRQGGPRSADPAPGATCAAEAGLAPDPGRRLSGPLSGSSSVPSAGRQAGRKPGA